MERQPVKLDEFQKAKYLGILPKLSKLDCIKILMIAQYYDTLKTEKTHKRSYSVPTDEIFKARKSKNFGYFAYVYLFLKTYRVEYKLYIEACVNMYEKFVPYPSQLSSISAIKFYVKYKIRKGKELNLQTVKADKKFNEKDRILEDLLPTLDKVETFVNRRHLKGQTKIEAKTEYLWTHFTELSPYYMVNYPEIYKNIDVDSLYDRGWYDEINRIANNKHLLEISRNSYKEEEKARKIPHGILNLDILAGILEGNI